MYERTYWLDHVLDTTNEFTVTQLDGDVYTIVPHGKVMQQGTYQDAAHFNKIEEAIFANETATELLINFARQNKWYAEEHIPALEASVKKLHAVETGTISLTNSLTFPFNNSQKTVALKKVRDMVDYVVVAEVQSAVGNAGEIEVSDMLTNGFKVSYTGSASSVTVKYKIFGGYNA